MIEYVNLQFNFKRQVPFMQIKTDIHLKIQQALR